MKCEEILKLTDRLLKIAELCENSRSVIDVGCDHAKLPIYLIENGIIERAVATDVKEGPIKNARKNIEANGLSDRIRTNLSNGLDGLSRDDGDTVIIAGMGGEEISFIISKAQWTRDRDVTLILQPMTMEHKLRAFLRENGYKTERECVAVEGKKVYIILKARFEGGEIPIENYDLFSNALEKDENRIYYIKKLINRYQKMQNGHIASKGEESEELAQKLSLLSDILQKTEDNEGWHRTVL